ncbi:SDR family oxidoreductase [Mucilaginibacter sp. cycad4]|uniref:SDR family NAD(P)-dependent oxidoreductase n=1 Tax=Mucilaginibacter sp. cycad4 TaxID=3342096 RepID=UPI002AAB76C9|nr:SDR family oxidoreductase [Mucilaginibacter gossypii]WPV02012.1 SDR family oxidoreductase [Mucilaginibacter gossypii]
MVKKIIVLGGSSGIGKATSQRFAREGWRVLVASHDLQECVETVNGLEGKGHIACKVDVRDEKDLIRLQQLVKAEFLTFDTLVNTVGISQSYPAIDSDFSAWDESLQVMLYGSVKSCRLLIPLINDGGRIIHVTSIHFERVAFGSSAYGMAKAAITQFTRSLAMELAPRNILANTIAPGFVNTPMSVKKDGKNEVETEWFKDNYIKYDHLPLKRVGRPEEVAGVAWFLSGPDASYMTGSVVVVDGGLTITF